MTTPESFRSSTEAPTPFWRHEDFPEQATQFNLEVDEMRIAFRKDTELASGNADSTANFGQTS